MPNSSQDGNVTPTLSAQPSAGQLMIGFFRLIRGYVALLFGPHSYPRRMGWWHSRIQSRAVDRDWQPLPWFTYASIEFLTPRIRKDFRVFEFGSGYSTLWWAARVAEVKSCEHNETWFRRIATMMPENVSIQHRSVEAELPYADEILRHDEKFQIVVVDGVDRLNCIVNAPKALTVDGVIILDNSDREQYREGIEWLLSKGFKTIDFISMGPINSRSWSTSVFYRPDNCLGL